MSAEQPDTAPHVHVVRGTPDDVELAALVAGLAAVAAPDDPAPEAAPGAWTDRSRHMRGGPRAPVAGPDAWRWSLRG